jgi:hypothetical protein
VLFAVAAAAACSRQPVAAQAEATQSPAAAQAPANLPAMQMQRTGATRETPRVVSGTVVETMNAAKYTYMRVKTESEELWAATGQFDVKVGERVDVPLEMAMENFHSKALNRDFPVIYFVSQVSREGQAPQAMTAAQSPHGSTPPSVEKAAAVTTPMQPPAGGTTIANVWANRASLAGKPVTVRGKVVKYNGGILGVNWLHIQDGTGETGKQTGDLAVTTSDTATVGDVVTATGTVAIDKDFGAGYSYAVILERSTLKR